MALEQLNASAPPVGFVGAGRLGRALAARWYRTQRQKAPLWSRRFQNGVLDDGKGCDAFSIVSLDSVLAAEIVVAAIPNKAIGALASICANLAQFDGVLLVAGIDLPTIDVQRFIPASVVVRIVPILLPGRDDVASLVLEPAAKDARWLNCMRVLRAMGPVYYVDDEAAFDVIMHLTSPFSVVTRVALKRAVGEFLTSKKVHPKWMPIAERVIWQALLTSPPSQGTAADSGETEVATPGGITEAGLREVETLSNSMLDVLSAMSRRADELRLLTNGQ
ncbi:hypothetical protein [Bradyrhizobium sp. SZCCHNR3015]|uniref:hypothetical protein n=1 Tax=Bradyrhizobium sp. SZCCHNR3015 TaxID=3057395 RepID=UPI002916D61B|nr:hypothetical protein [Bradyrhizobium sp. SZCCHNR3015]